MLSGKFLQSYLPPTLRQYSVRVTIAIAVIILCLWGILNAWRAGASRLVTYQGRMARLLAQADSAVSRTPNDPEAYSGRAFVLLNIAGAGVALPDYERAAALRPRDYFLWLELGRARDMADDEQGALAALEQAVKLAPAYAQPRWQLGNVLFRVGRDAEAFQELRRAALSDPNLLPNLIDLAWGASGSDPARVEQVIQPERASWRLALAKFFVRRGKTAEAVAQFKAAGGISQQDRRMLLGELIAAKRYSEAYQIWAYDSGVDKRSNGIGHINDGGFEGKMSREELGFSWQPARDTQGFRLSLDRDNPHTGTQSLRIDFNGDSNPNQPILSQLILVEPKTSYRLRFAARTEEIVTGGMPFVGVSDAVSKESRTLAQSTPFRSNSEGWKEFIIDFTAGETTDAVLIYLQRQNCSSGPCPIFGRLWLDNFVIEKVAF